MPQRVACAHQSLLEFYMHRLSHLLATAAIVTLIALPSGRVQAQTTPAAPAATTPPAATSAPATTSSETTGDKSARKSKKPVKKRTRRQEIDRSIDRGTVPARYRNSVPKEYQQYIPFEKQ